MDKVLQYVFLILPPCLFCGIFAYSMHRDRSRYRNIVLLVIAFMSLYGFIASVTGRVGVYMMGAASFFVFLMILIFPIFLMLNGLTVVRREGRSLENLLSLLMGLGMFIGEWMMLIFVITAGSGGSMSESLLVRIVSRLSTGMLFVSFSAGYVSVVFVAFMLYCMFLQIIPHTRDFDYVIIHGAGLRKDGTVTKLLAERCDKAIELFRKDPTPPMLVPSGGQGADEVRSEAAAMAEYLKEHGVPEEKILLEDRSTTTLENIRFSKELIESRGSNARTALVTSNYHVYRAMRYARRVGLKATGVGAHVALYYWPSALIREFVAVHHERKHFIFFMIGYLLVVGPILAISIFQI